MRVRDDVRHIGCTTGTSQRAEEGKDQIKTLDLVVRIRVLVDVERLRDGSNANEETTVEIRVGRTSEDNDIVSFDPTNDPNEWWMHAAVALVAASLFDQDPSGATFLDAALLAAKFSSGARRSSQSLRRSMSTSLQTKRCQT